MADIDYNSITIFAGNYSFWKEASELILQQKSDQNRKTESKIEDLKSFVARFSANASKAKQASSRKNLLDKLTLEDIKPSSRRYPHVHFKQKREAGNNLLSITSLTKSIEGKTVFEDLSFTINTGEKVAFVGKNRHAVTAFFQTLVGEEKPDSGKYEWGITTSNAYFPKENAEYFTEDLNLIDWLRQFSEEKEETFIRSFLGKMLFSGDESQKMATVLSGGEKVRCMLAKMMLAEANVLILDEPTNHLDLESISALNNGLIDFKGTVLFTSHDHLFIQTIADRIIEITPSGFIDRHMTYDEYLEDAKVKKLREKMYASS
jgi:ATPase subunit of ABC transporter with duplicated ATPase domains